MKNLFVAVSIVLLAFSCSSDDEGPEYKDPPVKVPLTQYQVDYKISNEEIESYPLGDRKTRTFVLDKNKDAKLGNLGVIIHFHNSLEVGYTAYDVCCPIHWEDTDPLKHKLTFDPKLLEFDCNVKEGGFPIGSSFSLWDGKPSSGYARKNKISLVKYKIEQYPESSYPNYPEAEGRYITNPNYKGK